jgi:hypothetical protein
MLGGSLATQGPKVMNSYQEVSNQAEMDGLLHSIRNFHDSMTKEIHMINRGAVLHDHSMVMSLQFDAQVLIQSQWEPFAVELLFIDILELTISDPRDYFGATGLVEQESAYNETSKIEMKFDSSFKISARQLFYRVQSEYLGMKARLNSEVPSPEAIPARLIGDQWRQCSSCSDAWEESVSQIYSVCPKCLALTEIKS